MSDSTAPDARAPDSAVPGPAVPASAVSGSAVPDSAVTGSPTPRVGSEPTGATKDGRSTTAVPANTPRSGAVLVAYGVSVGIFVLYTVGWLIAVLRVDFVPPVGVLDQIMAYLSIGLAIASGPLWFMGVFLLTRRRKPVIQVLWQLLGIILLVPWPFILGV